MLESQTKDEVGVSFDGFMTHAPEHGQVVGHSKKLGNINNELGILVSMQTTEFCNIIIITF